MGDGGSNTRTLSRRELMAGPYPKEQQRARKELAQLFQSLPTSRTIHYSCESLDNRESGVSPRITSIAIYDMESRSSESFSIHQVAEERQIDLAQIEANYDTLERLMLDRFFAYLRSHQDSHYVHWKMRDANYGFEAIEHRYRVLKGDPFTVPSSNRHDLSELFFDIYGSNYADHPRLESIAKANGITLKGFIPGSEEPAAFARGEYVALHQSTLRKIYVIADLAERGNQRSLKTNASWWVMNGGSIRSILIAVVTNPIVSGVSTLVGVALTILGIVLTVRATSH
jgi:hypothetical protein